MIGAMDIGSKDDIARRNSQKAGITYQLTQATKARWRARERRDERFAAEMGVAITYAEIRR